MKEKIVQLMKSEGLTSSRLAEILEIQPSGVSHLVSGRNKPSFELLQKILRRFPNINPYWLILDDENIYRTPSSGDSPLQSEPAYPVDNLFAMLERPPAQPQPTRGLPSANIEQIPNTENSGLKIEQRSSHLASVILLFDDGSCQSYRVK